MNRPFVVGLTGPTGAGKSEVARVLRHHGCVVVDADVLSRRVVEKGSHCLRQLAETFSSAILLPDGSLNRPALAAVAFASREKTQQLNEIVHPEVIRLTHEQLHTAAEAGVRVVVIDAPLLFQAGMETLCDYTVAVLAPAEIREQRIQQRDGLTKEQARHRMSAQPDDRYYRERATAVLMNDGELEILTEAAEALFAQVEVAARER